jgi:HEAT repeat protein
MTYLGYDYRLILLGVLIGVVSLSTLLFAISAISLRLHSLRTEKRREHLEQVWEPMILDVLAGDPSAERLWTCVPAGRALWLIEYLLRLARRLRGEDIEALAKIAAPYLKLVAARLHHRSVEQRAFAVETLNLLGRGKYRREIAAALDDRAPLVAMIAARALARKGEPDYLEAILSRLHRFETWSPRLLSSLLASIGPAAAPVLRRALADADRPLLVRTLAASALRQLNDFEAADCAVQILESEQDREVLASSLRLLSRVGRPEQIEPVRALCRSEDFVVRAHALTALARLGTPEDVSILRMALDDESSWVAIHAATGLKVAGHLTQLRKLAASDHPRAELARQVLSEAA